MSSTDITAERLREVLHYDPETGEFRWKVSKGTARAGSVAGAFHSKGYWVIRIDRRSYRAHRLAWLYVHGAWPDHEIDHINGIRDDNRFANLRHVTPSQQKKNRARQGNNKSGFTGVTWHEGNRMWQARIYVDRKEIHLGYFDDWLYACRARLRASKKFGFHSNHGLRPEQRADYQPLGADSSRLNVAEGEKRR